MILWREVCVKLLLAKLCVANSECSILPNWPHYPLKETFCNPAACQRTRWGRSSPPSWSSTPTARSTRGSSRRCSKRWEVWWFCWFLHSCPVLKHWGFLVIYLCSDAAWTRRNLHAEAHLPMLRREREWLHWLCRIHGSITTYCSTKTWFPYILAGPSTWCSIYSSWSSTSCPTAQQKRLWGGFSVCLTWTGTGTSPRGSWTGSSRTCSSWSRTRFRRRCVKHWHLRWPCLGWNGFFQATKKFLIESAFAEMDKDENGKVSGIFFKYHAFYVWSCLVFLMLRQRS